MQIRDSSEWDSLVEAAFRTLDRDADDSLGAGDLAGLLCGEAGCEVEDTVGAALREADADHDGALSLQDFKQLLAGHDADLALFEARVAPAGETGGEGRSPPPP